MKEKTFYFKNEYFGKDWQQRISYSLDLESFAQEIAEQYWSDDPCDPCTFEFLIEVKEAENGEIKKFKICAESEVRFFCVDED